MIDSISYKLVTQPGTDSEKVFKPNKNLISFIQKSDSRIFKITASNSQGKSFLLNLLSFAFYGLTLSEDELIPSLKREIDLLSDQSYQALEFNIDLKDPDGFLLNSSFNNKQEYPLVKMTDADSETILSEEDFFQNYVLMYDIPEKPLERIYKIIKSLKGYNAKIIDKLTTVEKVIDKCLSSIENQQDEELIEQLETKINTLQYSVDKNTEKSILLLTVLENINVYKSLIKLNRINSDLESLEQKKNEYKKNLKSLAKPSKLTSKGLDVKILKIKNKIESLGIKQMICEFTDMICDEDCKNIFYDKMEGPERGMVEDLKGFAGTINDLFFDYDVVAIANVSRTINFILTYPTQRVFNHLEEGLEIGEYDLVQKLLEDFISHKGRGFGDVVSNSVFNKNVNEIIEDLNKFNEENKEMKFISNLKIDIQSSLKEINEKIETAKVYSKDLASKKEGRGKSKSDIKYFKIEDKIKDVTDKIMRMEEKIGEVKNALESLEIYKSNVSTSEKIHSLVEEYNGKVRDYLVDFDENCLRIEREQKEISNIIGYQERDLDEMKFRVNIELEKGTSVYIDQKEVFQKIHNKLNFFIKYIHSKNSIINEDSSLDIEKAEEFKPYFKLIGDFVANQFDNKVLYQDKYENISTVDYTSKTPFFVTEDDRRISFQGFSGGQQSSNYLKAKLNTKINKKHIVLFDEVANMDNESQGQIIKKLKEMDKENRLLLAILVEPHKEPGVFEIQSY